MLQWMRTRAAEWAERVRAWREGGLSAEEFAKVGGYRSKTLWCWASELAIRVGGAIIAARRGFDPKPLRDVMSALGSGR